MGITATMNKLRHRVYKCNDVLFTFFYSDWFIILFDHKFCQFNPTKFYKYKQFNLLEIPPLRTFGSAPAFYFIKTCTSSFITVVGEIRNKYMDCACPREQTFSPKLFKTFNFFLISTASIGKSTISTTTNTNRLHIYQEDSYLSDI